MSILFFFLLLKRTQDISNVLQDETYHVWIFLWISDTDVCKFNVQVLKHTSREMWCQKIKTYNWAERKCR